MRTFGKLRLNDDREHWVLEDIEPHVSIRLKQIFPSIPKTATCPYALPATPIMAADLDWFTSRYPLGMSEEDRHVLKDNRLLFEHQQAELERILIPGYEAPPYAGIREGQRVRNYQAQAVELWRARGKLLLGDEGGLGKTYTAAAGLCNIPGTLPAAVVCDPHMQQQWKEKIEAFTTLRVHLIKKTKPYNLPEADVYVFRISQVAGWVEIFETGFFKSYVHDEPQSLRTGLKTYKGQACYKLSATVSYRLGLTATPIYNYGAEMWNIMQFFDPYVLGSFGDFDREWCSGIYIRDPKALGTYLREQHALLRRLKSDVGQELPPVSRIVEHVDYDAKTVASIEDLARQLAIKATTGTFFERGQAARDLDVMVRQQTGVAKAHAVAQFVQLLCEAGEKVILWGWHRDVYDIWMAHFRNAGLHPVLYSGSESAAQKEWAKKAFIEADANPLIMSLRSGAGVDGLQHVCSTGVFGELDWSPGIHQQCLWRIDREGQTQPVTGFFLVTDDGSDPPMMDVLGIKASEAHQIVDPQLGVERVPNDTSNLRRLVDRYLEKKRGANAAQSQPSMAQQALILEGEPNV